ncbi:MAG: YIP1 family protein [Ardenticatenales bacterium]|nr:YIP1 family protein [Ardenticatenales bacterium]
METPVFETPISPPWITIWTSPRKTIRQLVERDPTYLVYRLAALAGVSEGLSQAARRNWVEGGSLPFFLVMIFLAAPLASIISQEIGALLLSWAGRQFGGVGSTTEVRTVLAWARVPEIALIPLLGVKFLIYAYHFLATAPPRSDFTHPLVIVIVFLIVFAELIAAFCSFVISIQGLAEVHELSVWKALVASFLPVLIILVPFMCLLFLISDPLGF